ncbi:MAG: glycine--tRNA ligase subunit beta [Desulfovibrionaceae bacterium]
MPTFVFEIGCEEMPARFVPGLAAELKDLLTRFLGEAMIVAGELVSYATPRRIAVLAPGLAATQRAETEEVTGPPVRVAYGPDGALTKAGEGFARTQGVDPADLYTVTTPKGEYLAVRKAKGGGASIDILPGICRRCIASLSFPKKMHWGSYDFTFGRPIRWLLALLDEAVVPFEAANLTSGRLTWGHRVMGPGPFEVPAAADWLAVVREQGHVAPDPAERMAVIRERGAALAEAAGGRVVWNDRLLGEVANLVEWPEPCLGRIGDRYLELPREVLLTSMEQHQKSFGVEGPDGRLLPYFLTTLNLIPPDEALVRKGWERVLKARLEDARFFWEADTASSFDAWLGKLENVVFIGPIGTMGDKARRLERLCLKIAARLPGLTPAEVQDLGRAGRLAKADLVSDMVLEFDTLQGIMGGIYARRFGESETVAQGVYEQYLPAGPDTPAPSTLAGAVVALADKADTLAGCFGLKMIPTGANDPYALRRAALGVCRVILEHGLRLDVGELLGWAQTGYGEAKWKLRPAEALDKLLDFFSGRLRAFFTGKGFDTRVVDAAIGAGFTDVRTLALRVAALQEFSKATDFERAVLTFKRAANIIRKQADEAGVTITGAFEEGLLQEPQEQALAAVLAEAAPRMDELWGRDDFDGLFAQLGDLRPAVDAFFDHVMVMCEDESLRANRLNLLGALVSRLGRLADFALLQV